MGSFYGNVVIGGSGSGVSSYDELSNRPIINLIGTETSPTILYELDYGIYLLKGSYKYTTNDETKQTTQLMIQIFQDEVTNQKVAKFEKFENQDLIVYTVSYDDATTFNEDRLSIGGDSSDEGVSSIAEEVILGTF